MQAAARWPHVQTRRLGTEAPTDGSSAIPWDVLWPPPSDRGLRPLPAPNIRARMNDSMQIPTPLPFGLLQSPERIAEVHGIAVGEPIEVDPASQPDRVFLGISPDRRIRLRPRHRKALCFSLLAARSLSDLIVLCTPKPGGALPGGSGARISVAQAFAPAGALLGAAGACAPRSPHLGRGR